MRWMDLGPYEVCHVGLCIGRAQWNRAMREHNFNYEFKKEVAFTVFFDDDIPIILVYADSSLRKMDRIEAIGYCIHEAVHVWQYICEYIRAGRTGREIEAYSVQWIGKWLIKELKL